MLVILNGGGRCGHPELEGEGPFWAAAKDLAQDDGKRRLDSSDSY